MQECCTDIKMDIVKRLIYQIERELAFASRDKLTFFLYGYPRKYTDAYAKSIARYLTILNKIERAILSNSTQCLECCEYDKLVAAVNKVLPKRTIKYEENVNIDDGEKVAWELAHPYCVSRTRWEELAYHVCGDLKMTIKATDVSCNLTFDMSTDILSCDTVATLSVYEKLCDLDYKVVRTDEECKIDYTLLMEKHPDCGLTFSGYTKLLECSMSFDIINQILCDTSDIYFKKGLPTIKTPLGEYILRSDIQFDAVLAPSDCADTLCKSTGSCTLDSAGFYKRLLSDYDLTTSEKEKILAQIK